MLSRSLPPSVITHPAPICSPLSPPRFLPFHSSSRRPHGVSPSSPRLALAHGGSRWQRRQRGGEVLLLVRSLVQQPADGPAALRGQETPQERSQSTPPGAASGQSRCHGEHRSASWARARHKCQEAGTGVVATLYVERRSGGEITLEICGGEGGLNVHICLLLWCTFHRCNTEVSHTTSSQIKLATSGSYCKDSHPPCMWTQTRPLQLTTCLLCP